VKKNKGWYFEEKLQFMIRHGQEDTAMEKSARESKKTKF